VCFNTLLASDARTLNDQGTRALEANDLPAALDRFRSASKLEPSNSEVRFNIGLTLLRMGRAKEAVASLQGVSKPTDEARYLLGMAHFQLAEYEKAAEEIKDLRDFPRMDHVLYMREECNRLLGRTQEARENFRELNRRFPDSPWMHFLLGNAYENQANPEQARAEYKLALARDPHQPNANFALGYLYFREQDYEQARPWFENELAVQSCHALASFYLGEMARAAANLDGAVRHYRQSIACNADSAEAHLKLGSALAELKRNQEALSELKRAAQLAPENSSAHYRLALRYNTLGRDADAQLEYAAVKRIQEERPKVDIAPVTKP